MQELIQKIEQWAEDRNIIKGSKPIDQAMKLFSEFGELSDHVGDNELSKIPDDIGDVFTVLTILNAQSNGDLYKVMDYDEPYEILSLKEEVFYLSKNLVDIVDLLITYTEPQEINFTHAILSLKNICTIINVSLEDCIKTAYNDIKDRKGVLIDGVFIKESNPAYAKAIKSLENNYSITEDSK